MGDEMKEIERIVECHPSLKIAKNKQGKDRVICELTSHEMPCTLKAIETYISGKKYRYESKNKLTSKELEMLSQYLVLKKRGQLYCVLTKRYLNNQPHHIKLHLNGKRFQRALQNVLTDEKSTGETTSELEKAGTLTDHGVGMWVPSDSESETPEAKDLGSDFEETEAEKTGDFKDDYLFDILGVQDRKAVENSQEILTVESDQMEIRSQKRKRLGKDLKGPVTKLEKLQKNNKKKQRKKTKLL